MPIHRVTRAFIATLLITLSLLLPAASARAAGPVFSPPRQYYLSLGDSIAYGYRQATANQLKAAGTLNTAAFVGVSDYFARMLGAIDPGITLVNYACVGETSTTFSTRCPYAGVLPAHDPYTGSQLNAALAFLKAHPGQVGTITLDLGANDAGVLIARCGGLTNVSLGCLLSGLPAALKQLRSNLDTILAKLRAADPRGEIIVLQLYNPYAVVSRASDVFAQSANAVIGDVAAANSAVVADAYQDFNVNGKQPRRLCRLTGFCTPLLDIHPSPAGYLRLAQLYWDASGYARLKPGRMISFTGTAGGRGEVRFGLSCAGLTHVSRHDLLPAGQEHIIWLTGKQLHHAGIAPGMRYRYRVMTVTASGVETDNGGACYSATES